MCLKKRTHVKITLKNLTQKKKLCIHLLVLHSVFTSCSFDSTKNKLDCFRGRDSIERYCKNLKEHATRIINYEKKEMIPLTDEENKFYETQKSCYIFKKKNKLILIKKLKIYLNYIIMSKIINITQERLVELLIVFVI